MRRNTYQALVLTVLSGLTLAACESSSRFGGAGTSPGRAATGAPPPFIAAPTAPVATTNLPPPVTAQPLPSPNLPPPGGGPQASLGLPPAGQSMPIDPDGDRRAPEAPRVQPPPPPPVVSSRLSLRPYLVRPHATQSSETGVPEKLQAPTAVSRSRARHRWICTRLHRLDARRGSCSVSRPGNCAARRSIFMNPVAVWPHGSSNLAAISRARRHAQAQPSR
jgi:hypothetical protein